MGHDPDNRLNGQEKLQIDHDLLHHKAGNRMGHINLCAQEAARQAVVEVVLADSDVARVVDRRVTLVTANRLGEIVG